MVFQHFFRRIPRGFSASIWVKRYLRALCYVFNLHTSFLIGLACTAVFLCDRYNFKYNMDFTLVATGTTFPLVFTISQAFARRERATVLLANLKASVLALFYMHRDWDQTAGYPGRLGDNTSSWAQSVKAVLQELLLNLRCYLTFPEEYESVAEKRLNARRKQMLKFMLNDMELSGGSQYSFNQLLHDYDARDPAHAFLIKCYRNVSQLSVMNEQLTHKAGYTRGGEGGLSRTNQYLRYIIANLEELRMIRDYRTPAMMRHACGVMLHVFVIVLAPYFTHFCDSWIGYGYDKDRCPAGYSASIVYVIIVMLLYNIQCDVEQPFDMNGLDDVFFDLVEEVEDVAGGGISRRSTHHVLGGDSPNSVGSRSARPSMDLGGASPASNGTAGRQPHQQRHRSDSMQHLGMLQGRRNGSVELAPSRVHSMAQVNEADAPGLGLYGGQGSWHMGGSSDDVHKLGHAASRGGEPGALHAPLGLPTTSPAAGNLEARWWGPPSPPPGASSGENARLLGVAHLGSTGDGGAESILQMGPALQSHLGGGNMASGGSASRAPNLPPPLQL